MAKFDASKMTDKEPQSVWSACEDEIDERNRKKVVDTKQKMIEMAASVGMTLSQFVDVPRAYKGANGSSQVGKPKYQHPNDTKKTWTGNGRSPKWFAEAVESGIDKESMLIKHR